MTSERTAWPRVIEDARYKRRVHPILTSRFFFFVRKFMYIIPIILIYFTFQSLSIPSNAIKPLAFAPS